MAINLVLFCNFKVPTQETTKIFTKANSLFDNIQRDTLFYFIKYLSVFLKADLSIAR